MAQVIITINHREYPISCEDGGEIQIMKLGRLLDEKANSLTQALGQINENLLLAMVGLLVADELSETKKELTSSADRTEDLQKITELENAIQTANQQISVLKDAKLAAEQKSSAFENTAAEALKKVADLETNLASAQEKITLLEEEKSITTKKISDTETTALESMEQISSLEKNLTQAEQKIAELEKTLLNKETECREQFEKIKELETLPAQNNENTAAFTAEELLLIDEELASEINSLSNQIKSVALKLKSL